MYKGYLLKYLISKWIYFPFMQQLMEHYGNRDNSLAVSSEYNSNCWERCKAWWPLFIQFQPKKIRNSIIYDHPNFIWLAHIFFMLSLFKQTEHGGLSFDCFAEVWTSQALISSKKELLFGFKRLPGRKIHYNTNTQGPTWTDNAPLPHGYNTHSSPQVKGSVWESSPFGA